MSSYEFYKISKNTFFTEHLWATASVDAPGKGGISNVHIHYTNISEKSKLSASIHHIEKICKIRNVMHLKKDPSNVSVDIDEKNSPT